MPLTHRSRELYLKQVINLRVRSEIGLRIFGQATNRVGKSQILVINRVTFWEAGRTHSPQFFWGYPSRVTPWPHKSIFVNAMRLSSLWYDRNRAKFHWTRPHLKTLSRSNFSVFMFDFLSLVEEDEKAYWEKINADRVTRYNAKRGKKRGTEKVQSYAQSFPLFNSLDWFISTLSW